MKTSKHFARRAIRALTAFLFAGLQAALVLNAQPPPCCPQPSGMTNWYRFEAPNALADQTGNNNLTGNGGIVAGKVGTGKPFNGTLASVLTATTPNQPSFGAGDFSFDAWINVPAVDGQVEVLAEKRQVSPLRGWSFYMYKGALGMQIADAGNNWNYGSTAQIPLNQLVLVAVVVHRKPGPAKVEFYINGQFQGSDPIGAPANSANVDTNTKMKLGSRTISNDGFFKGVIDEVELFDRALTPQEIMSIFAAGTTGKCIGCPGKDPQIASITVPAQVATGGDMQYNIVFRNNGLQNTGNVEFNMWLDKSSTCSASPAAWTIGQTSNSNIAPMTSVSSATSYEIFVPAGNYYMCWKTDPANKIAECPPNGETNNLTITPVKVVASCTGIDLKIGKLFTSASTFSKTQPFKYVIWVFNAGAVTSSPFKTQVYLVSGSNQYLIDTIIGPANGFDFQVQGVRTVTLPSGLPLGQYTLLAVADFGNVVAECNETNNTYQNPNPITIN